MKRIMTLALFLGLLTGCGMQAQSEVSFKVFMQSQKCGFTKIMQPTYKICIEGAADNSNEKLRDWFSRAVRTWTNAFRDELPDATDEFEFTCNNPHLSVNVLSGSGTSMATAGRVTKYYIERPYSTVLHELGHAFMCLGDTYVGRTAMNCQAGQPQSVMCGNYKTRDADGFTALMEDDINGAKHMVTNNKNLILVGPGRTASQQIYVAIAYGQRGPLLYMSTRSDVDKVLVCKEDISAEMCMSSSFASRANIVGTGSGNRKLLVADYALNNNETYTIVATDSFNNIVTSRKIKINN